MFQSTFNRALAVVAVCAALTAAEVAPKIFQGETDWAARPGWGSGSNMTPAFTPDGKTVCFTHFVAH
jgi:hypothetical protein